MATHEQLNALRMAYSASVDSGHIFPSYAACEAATESRWFTSELSTRAHNLFGQKQSHPPIEGTSTIVLPTREYLNGVWQTVQANWAVFPDLEESFRARMDLLRRLAPEYPDYAAALGADTGENFVVEVSKTWSTDPDRARTVLAIYNAHRSLFTS